MVVAMILAMVLAEADVMQVAWVDAQATWEVYNIDLYYNATLHGC